MENETPPSDLESYRSAVRYAFDTDLTQIMLNSSKYHAKIIIAEIFRHAKEEVKVFCTQLRPEIWCDEDIISSVIACFSNGVEMEFCTQNGIQEGSKIKNLLHNLNIKIHEGINSDRKDNFIVADKKMYRYEPNAEETCAIANANDSDFANKLHGIFTSELAVDK